MQRLLLLAAALVATIVLAACGTVARAAHDLNKPPAPPPVYIGKVVGNYDGHPFSGPTWHAWMIPQSGPKKNHKVYLEAIDNECAFQAAIHNGQIIRVQTWQTGELDGSEVTILKPRRDTVASYDSCATS